jgi:hypothetical protein
MLQFEFHTYDANAANPVITTERLSGDASARSKAGRLAKQNGGPVDLARAGGADWADRYLTTASPSPHHVSGYQFERLT